MADDWDPLGRRDRLRRLALATVAAIAAGVIAWHVLESDPVQRWIWSHARWGRLEARLDLAGAASVPLAFAVTWFVLARRSARRWRSTLLPEARARGTSRASPAL
ncbi:MAG TPA: hypothetical protein VMJ10_33200 [Kofleriaceae bacterium]|nr:hypothetical protein [Kofleriaceae bacterium]